MDRSELERHGLTSHFAAWFADQLTHSDPLYLIDHLLFAFTQHAFKKRRFRGTYLEFGTYLKATNAMFSVGALLTHTSAKDPVALTRLVMDKTGGDPNRMYSSARQKAQERIDQYTSRYGTEPLSLSSLHFASHMLSMDIDCRTDASEIRKVALEKYDFKRHNDLLKATAGFELIMGMAIPVEHGELFAQMQDGPDPITPDTLNLNAAFYTNLLDVPDSMSKQTSIVSPHSCDALELCRIWARCCRPDLLHLIAEES